MKAFKGFNPDLTCRGFQYAEGGEYETDTADLCSSGFHAVEAPLDVFGYYGPAESVYRVVELDGVSEQRDSDSKVSARKIRIGAAVSLAGLAQAHVEFVSERIDRSVPQTVAGNAATNTGYRSAATNTGYRSAATNTGYGSAATNTGSCSAATNTGYGSAATNTGDYSAATNTGDYSAATNTGSRSAATNTGYRSAATNTGYRSAATNTGDYSAATNTGSRSAATNTGYGSAATNTGYRSAATNTGDYSAATNTGYRSAATNTGDYSAATVEGEESIAVVTGRNSRAAGALGCWLVLTERGADWHILGVKAVKVGSRVNGVRIKPGVLYELRDGKVRAVTA